jgi:hypothetical protein
MNIHQLILVSIGIPTLSGCLSGKGPISSVAGCDPDTSELDIQSDVTVDDVDYVLNNWGYITSVDDIDCEALCRGMNSQIDGWETDVDTCDYELDVDAYNQALEDTATDGSMVVGNISCQGTKFEYYCEGRRPLGFQDQDSAYYAKSAQLEAASVIAFVQLAKQLQGFGAPTELLERCLSAAKDEIHHAQMLATVAKQRKETIPRIVMEETSEDILTIAIHNACEGCIFETWSALEAALKSDRAEPSLRGMYAQIAADEMKHAQLSWDIHAWLVQQLSPQQIAIVEENRSQALARLQQQIPVRIKAMPAELGLSSLQNHEEIVQRFTNQILAS